LNFHKWDKARSTLVLVNGLLGPLHVVGMLLCLVYVPGAWAGMEIEPEDFYGIVLFALLFLAMAGVSFLNIPWVLQPHRNPPRALIVSNVLVGFLLFSTTFTTLRGVRSVALGVIFAAPYIASAVYLHNSKKGWNLDFERAGKGFHWKFILWRSVIPMFLAGIVLGLVSAPIFYFVEGRSLDDALFWFLLSVAVMSAGGILILLRDMLSKD